MKDFRKLNVWRRAHQLALAVYRATGGFPKAELYGLTAQVRRSSAPVPANIAEGCGRSGDVELGRFLTIAMGSASELEYHLLLSRDLGLLSGREHGELEKGVTEVKRMLASLIRKLKADRRPPTADG